MRTDRPRGGRLAALGDPLAVVLLLGAYFALFLDAALNLSDEGFPLTHAVALETETIDGASLDRLLTRRLGILLFAVMRIAGSHDLLVTRYLWAGLRIVIGLLALALARRLLPRPLAILAALGVAISCGPLYRSWFPFCLMLMLWLTACRDHRRSLLLAPVALVGGALFALYSVVIGWGVVLPIFAFLFLEQVLARTRRPCSIGSWLGTSGTVSLQLGATAMIGALLFDTLNVLAIILLRGGDLQLVAHGPLAALRLLSPAHLAEMFGVAAAWSADGQESLGRLFWSPDGDGALPLLQWFPGVFFLFQPLLAVWAMLQARRGSPGESRVLLLLGSMSLFAGLKASVRLDLSHVLQGSGPGLLLLFHLIWSRAGASSASRTIGLATVSRVGRRLVGLAAVTLLLGFFSAVLLSAGHWAGSIGSLARAERRLALERATVRLGAAQAEQITAVVSRIQQWTTPRDPILALPFCPLFYHLSGRPCVADDAVFRYALPMVLPGVGIVNEARFEDAHLAELLEERQVEVVAVCPPIHPRWDLDSGRLPRTLALLESRYAPAYVHGDLTLLRRVSYQTTSPGVGHRDLLPAPVLFDVDPGIDDALALLLALRSPELAVVGITVVAGNVEIEDGLANARGVVQLAGRTEIPVAGGASRPLFGPLRTARAIHGENGLANIILPSPPVRPVEEDAVQLLARGVRLHHDQLIVIATGPLTNIATFVSEYPALARQIRRLVIMGGSLSGGNATPFAEYNFHSDPEAARLVLESGLPITLVGLDVTRHCVLEAPGRVAGPGHDGEVERFLDEVFGFRRQLPPDLRGKGLTLHDPLAVAVLLDPGLVRMRAVSLTVVTAAGPTRGAVVRRERGAGVGTPPLLQVGTEVKARGVLELFRDRVIGRRWRAARRRSH